MAAGVGVLRWAAAAALETEKGFPKIIGYGDLWMLKAALSTEQPVAGE